jgi:histidyl-tRNA synthetase
VRGISCEVYPFADKYGKQIKYADKRGISYCLFYEYEEGAEGWSTQGGLKPELAESAPTQPEPAQLSLAQPTPAEPTNPSAAAPTQPAPTDQSAPALTQPALTQPAPTQPASPAELAQTEPTAPVVVVPKMEIKDIRSGKQEKFDINAWLPRKTDRIRIK